jgi:hypothetical protein
MKKAVTRTWWYGFQQGNIGWHLVRWSNSEENMTNTSSGSNSTWGAFTPVMPAFIRLIAGVIVLVIIEAVVLGFPGIGQNISGSTISIANIAVFMIGLVVALIVFKFGTQLSKAVSDAYKNYQTWVPLLAYIFQIIAIVILYSVSSGIATQYFTSAPWAYPLIFLLIALLPTLRVVVNLVHALDNSSGTKHSTNN